jgi:hypothetical protein
MQNHQLDNRDRQDGWPSGTRRTIQFESGLNVRTGASPGSGRKNPGNLMTPGAEIKLDWTKLLNGDRRRPSSSDKPIEHRFAFERDYDRLLFSTPVRRLADKTQVSRLSETTAFEPG